MRGRSTEKTDTVQAYRSARIAVCGLAAGAIHFALTGLLNGVLLSGDLRAWMAQAGGTLHPLPQPIAMPLWAVMSASYGLAGLWYYAGLSARRGAGPATALLVGLSMWVVTKATVALDLFALGVMPTRILAGQATCGLIAIMVAIVAGAMLLDGRRAH